LFAAADGLFLVESHALNNVYLVIFGLLDSGFITGRSHEVGFGLAVSGICFASAAIKWNGLWFLLGAINLDSGLGGGAVPSTLSPDQPESVGDSDSAKSDTQSMANVLFYWGLSLPCSTVWNGFLICNSTQHPDSGKYTNEFWSITNELAVIHVHPVHLVHMAR